MSDRNIRNGSRQIIMMIKIDTDKIPILIIIIIKNIMIITNLNAI